MKKFKSKIGLEIILFIAIVLGTTSIIMIINCVCVGLAINLIGVGFASYMFMSTYYIINGNDLIVKCGFMINITVKIDRIKKIVETNNPLSSPAASLDRLAIYYNDTDSVMISPKDKIIFINHLIATNSKIEVILKKNKGQK